MRKKALAILLICSITILSLYVSIQGGSRILQEWGIGLELKIQEFAQKAFAPGMYELMNGDVEWNWLEQQVMAFVPISAYVEGKQETEVEIEDELTYEMILAQQAKDEERMSEDLLKETEAASATIQEDISIEKLRNFNYLLSKYYTVDSTTMIGEEQLQVDELLGKNMKIDTSTDGPKVLIFHTHSQEAFADSKKGDSSTSIVGMGDYLAKQLNAMGIETIHDDSVYDIINGKLDRSKAYELSEIGVKEILNQYPSIEVVIDLHRDGVREDLHLVTKVDGKQTARIMFFNGLSRTKANGDISYLKNPYIQDNLAFSFQMQLAAESMYPGLARKIYLKGYRYSLHMMPKSLLIEAGAQTNTVAEMKNAMDCLAKILYEVIAA